MPRAAQFAVIPGRARVSRDRLKLKVEDRGSSEPTGLRGRLAEAERPAVVADRMNLSG